MDGADQVWAAQHAKQAVWVSDENEAWVQAVIEEVREGEHVRVKFDDADRVEDVQIDAQGRCFKGKGSRRIVPRDVGRKGTGLENMDDLTHLNEACVLHNVSARFAEQKIYTRTGPILVAMNPFEWLPIYGQDAMATYCETGRGLDELPPHCFAEAQKAYTALVSSGASQSLIICGESGAGKTETTKLMLEFLSHNYTEAANLGIAERIMKSNPLLEAFGNAKTLRNRNSSRFGKFIQLGFREKSIQGAHVSNYLLEKSRTVRQNKGERNYHIFYQLCRGADPKRAQALGLGQDMQVFRYLNQSGCVDVPHLDDATEFLSTLDAMKAIDVPEQEMDAIFRIVAAILHLGNVQFGKSDPSGIAGASSGSKPRSVSVASEDSSETAQVAVGGADIEETKTGDGTTNRSALRQACDLLGCDASKLAHALTVKYIKVNGKAIESPLDNRKAADLRDALAKSIYSQLFTHIVECVNSSLQKNVQTSLQTAIGILDIYGFESFRENGFEQLLINYANEKLQSLFNEQVFRAEETMYKAEGVPFSRTEIPNNEKCISLVNGIFKLMHDECLRMSAGSDLSLAGQITQQYRSHPHFGVCGPGSRRKGTSETNFAIVHFAGEIVYTCADFIKKNRDTLYPHVEAILAASKAPLVGQLFPGQARAEAEAKDGSNVSSRGPATSKLQETVAKAFAAQVNVLTEEIRKTNPIFVRCIKTNNELVSGKVDRIEVLRQLKNAGVIAALEMRRAGFPNRLGYKDFCLRCRALLPRDARVGDGLWRGLVEELFASGPIASWADGVAFGQTKVFLRANVLHEVDSVIQQHVTEQVISLQSIVRQYLHVQRFKAKRRLAIWTQAHFRGHRARLALAAQIRALEAKRVWFARTARLASLRDALAALLSRQDALRLAPGGLHIDTADLTLSLDAASACEKVSIELVSSQVDLPAADASLEQLDKAVNTARTATDHAESALEQLQKAQGRLAFTLEVLDTRMQDFLRNEEDARSALTFVRPPQLESRTACTLVDGFCPGHAQAQQSVLSDLREAAKAVSEFGLDHASSLIDALDATIDAQENNLAEALAKKREIEANLERLLKAALSTRRDLVAALHSHGIAPQTHGLPEVQECSLRARNAFAQVCAALKRPGLLEGIDGALKRARVTTFDEASSDDSESESESECESDCDEDKIRTTFVFEQGLVNVEETDIALVHAAAAISDLEDTVTDAARRLSVYEACVADLRDELRESVHQRNTLETKQEEQLRPKDADVLFGNDRVRKAREQLTATQTTAQKALASASSLQLTTANLEGISESMRETTILLSGASEKYAHEMAKVRARLDRAREGQEAAYEKLVPALEMLKATRVLISRHHLEKRFKIRDAIQSVETHVHQVQGVLDFGPDGGLPSRSELKILPEKVDLAVDLVEACAKLVEEERELIESLREENLHMPVKKCLEDASEALHSFSKGIDFLTANEADARSLNAIYRATAGQLGSGTADENDNDDPIEVLLFVKTDPVQVVLEARERAAFALGQIESTIATQTAYIEESTRLEAERDMRVAALQRLEAAESEARAVELRKVRAEGTERLEPLRRLVATIGELEAHGLCETLSTDAIAQTAHVAYCLTLFEASVERDDPSTAAKQIKLTLAEGAKLQRLMFADRHLNQDQDEGEGEDEDDFKIEESSRYDLGTPRARWRALRAEVELRVTQMESGVANKSLESSSEDLPAMWMQALEGAEAALDCAELRANEVSHLPNASAMVLQVLGRDALSSHAAVQAHDAWDACESAVRYARSQVTRAEVIFKRSQRTAERDLEIRVRTRRIALKYVCARDPDAAA
ncbi:Myosin-12 [Hondaea fermentalgiana]|uniref:Myosin-12 n=1 Tax=Hondaea fermentalgiana TaxID=2315210 RepID=A0A2R5GE84_9STRA|nr:Myosin-12 [Hondaea fermentalgiana]|eukprot:GBG26943.1 Myosin-12 [Hondaea fermentalgiana]